MKQSVSILTRLSSAIGRAESFALVAVCGALCLLVALNVVLSAFGNPIYWSDEMVTNLMGVVGFIGASLLMHRAAHPGVTLISDFFSGAIAGVFTVSVAVANLIFAIALVWLSWQLFDPLGLARFGFVSMEFALETGNFTYQEPTLTLGIPKFLFWLVFPVVGICMTIHALDALLRALTSRRDIARPVA